MTIKNPTSLVVNFSADLQYDIGAGKINSVALLSDVTTLPFNSYVHGSLNISNATAEITLGKASTIVIIADDIISVTNDNMTNSINTKLFSYSGAVDTFYVSTASADPITIEYVLGTE
jgi:hypothetical protein